MPQVAFCLELSLRQQVTLLVWLALVKTKSKKSTEREELFVNGDGHDEVSAAPGRVALEGCAVQLQGVVMVVVSDSGVAVVEVVDIVWDPGVVDSGLQIAVAFGVLMESLLIDCFLPTHLYQPVTVHP